MCVCVCTCCNYNLIKILTICWVQSLSSIIINIIITIIVINMIVIINNYHHNHHNLIDHHHRSSLIITIIDQHHIKQSHSPRLVDICSHIQTFTYKEYTMFISNCYRSFITYLTYYTPWTVLAKKDLQVCGNLFISNILRVYYNG